MAKSYLNNKAERWKEKEMSKFENREEVAHAVNSEGLGYFLLNYTSSDSMPDDDLKGAFEKAEKALIEFQKLLPEVDEQ